MAILYLVSFGVLVVICFVYYLALPRPIPGIPYNQASAHSILGDLPRLLAHWNEKKENVDWMTMQCVELGSPIVQLFLQPFSYPLVVLSDHRETEDILIRRTREFDRSKIITELLGGLVKHATIVMPSHELFRSQRKIWANTMSPAFLSEVGGPQVHKATVDLIALWRRKQKLAGGRAFSATENIRHTAMDAIWAIAVGTQLGGVQSQLDFLEQKQSFHIPTDPNMPVDFPEAATAPVYTAISTLLDSVAGGLSSPFPKLYKFFMRQRSWYRRANALKQRVMRNLVRECREKFVQNTKDTDKRPASAMEHVLRMEVKEHGRVPKPGSKGDERQMIDETFMFLVAGHETTATTTTWGLKFFASNSAFQDRLYHAITTAFPSSSASQLPSADQIMAANIPLLDAAIAEVLRCSRTTTGAVRIATADAEVLGYCLPKGSQIMCSTEGVQFLHDAIPVDEGLRSATSKAARGKHKEWESEGKQEFRAERWLDQTGDTEVDVSFDPKAGPSLPFGGGPRGCFGKRLAYMELRIMIVLLLLVFEFQEVPEALATYEAVEGITVTRQPRKCYVRLGSRN